MSDICHLHKCSKNYDSFVFRSSTAEDEVVASETNTFLIVFKNDQKDSDQYLSYPNNFICSTDTILNCLVWPARVTKQKRRRPINIGPNKLITQSFLRHHIKK